MPRVAIKKKDYMKSDFSASIIGKLRKRKMTQSQLGKALGVTQGAVSIKLNQDSYSMDDLMIIFDVLEYTDEEILRFLRV